MYDSHGLLSASAGANVIYKTDMSILFFIIKKLGSQYWSNTGNLVYSLSGLTINRILKEEPVWLATKLSSIKYGL
jgi:hypothetical protein